jgi:hypothetical protein
VTTVRSDDPLGSETGTSGRLTARLSRPSSEPEGCKPYVADDFIPFSLPFYFIPSTSLPRAFEIAAVHSYPRPPPPTTSGSTPFDIFRRRRVPFGADALALACSSTFALALFLSRPPSPSVTIRRRCRVTRLPLSHPASPHPSFPTSVVAKLCLAVPRCCRRSNPRAHQAHLSLRGHGLL